MRAEQTAFKCIEQALERCGITDRTLEPAEKAALDESGYVVFHSAIDQVWLERLRFAFENAFRRESAAASGSPRSGTRHVADLAGRDEAFDGVYTHAKVLAATYQILGRAFRLSQLAGRDPLPGFGQQGLHADWLPRAPSESFSVVTTIWLLDDFTPRNGATRMVPGTHRLVNPVPKKMADPASRHPEERIIVALAGSVLVFNGHLWHSGTRNESKGPRRVLQCQFVARDRSGRVAIDVTIPDRLGAAARYILGD